MTQPNQAKQPTTPQDDPQATTLPVKPDLSLFQYVEAEPAQQAEQARMACATGIAAAGVMLSNLFKQAQQHPEKAKANTVKTVADAVQSLLDVAARLGIPKDAALPAKTVQECADIAQRAQEKLAKGKGK